MPNKHVSWSAVTGVERVKSEPRHYSSGDEVILFEEIVIVYSKLKSFMK